MGFGYDGGKITAIPRLIATAFMGFLGIFILIMDGILIAVCVDAFSEHRSKTAEYTVKQEIIWIRLLTSFAILPARST